MALNDPENTKLANILNLLTVHTSGMTYRQIAKRIGDTEPGANQRIRSLLSQARKRHGLALTTTSYVETLVTLDPGEWDRITNGR